MQLNTPLFPVLDLNAAYFLREHEAKDATAFLDYYTNPKVHQYILAKIPTNLLEAENEIMYCRELYYRHKGIYWSIAKKSNNTMIGALGAYIHYQHRRAELCFDLAQEYWGQGIISNALNTVKKYLFDGLQLNRLEALTLSSNTGAIAVLTQQGFTHEGRLKQYKFFRHQAYDVEIYALIREGNSTYVTF